MKAAICHAYGKPDALTIQEWPEPSAGDGEVVVRVRSAGVNYADLVVIAGQYQTKIDPPFVPGMEIAGEIASLGAGVNGWRIGDRVAALIDGGGYAEHVAVPAKRLFKVPDRLGFETAAGTFINYATSYGALHWRAGLAKGDTVLVLGGAGGVGLAAIALARWAGARVIGAASSAERCALMSSLGAHETIDYGSVSLRDRVLELTGKRGADVIIDPVGGEMGGLALRCIAWSGRIVTLGFPAGNVPTYPANILLVKNAAALGMYFGSYLQHAPDLVREAIASIQEALVAGSLPAYRIETVALDKLSETLGEIQGRRFTGKAVVTF